ncbi:DNA polymerase III subunit gamma/tau [Candidatus Seribacter sulfatis]|uniref:DNA polymerase III subunit gamma/tau n=1 Tax=Candidatus Seribacter sulfatis TaxID=3381756 RepID=UPI00389A8322
MSKNAYQVIARRWRPKQFSELVGQDHVVQTLGNAIKMGRIAHAYLFVGPRGTGKTTSARLFAKSLNWEDGPTLEVPEDSDIGNAIMAGRCLDVIEIDGASNNSVDQVRDLRDECQYAPTQCRFKIYVIDEVHMLSQQAFNALLKTLEEPPSHVKFVFATTESHKVLPTIVSRCQRFEFRSIPAPLIVSKLEEICKVESIEVELEAIEAIARMAMGGMRDAQSILDQMISFCGKTISQADVLEVYGLASKERIQILAQYVIDGDYNSIIQYTDSFSTEGLDFYRALLDLSDTFRELLLDTLRSKGETVNCSAEQCVRILDSLRQGEDLVRMGLSEKTNFEVTLFRAVQSGRSRSIDHVIRKISGLIPEDVKKKPKLNQVESASQYNVSTAEPVEELPKQSIVGESTLVAAGAGDLELNESAPLSMGDTPDGVVQKEEEVDNAFETEIPQPSKEKPRQIVDREKIEEKIAELPDGIKDILKDKFQADFVSIEKIDESKLI